MCSPRDARRFRDTDEMRRGHAFLGALCLHVPGHTTSHTDTVSVISSGWASNSHVKGEPETKPPKTRDSKTVSQTARRPASDLGKNLLRFLFGPIHCANVRDRAVADPRDANLGQAII